jgi:hypothetical protein
MEVKNDNKVFKCELCEYQSAWKSHLKRHNKQVHDKIKDEKCPQCDFTCSTKGDLKRHNKMIHDKIKDEKCPQCDFTCSMKCYLKKHIKQVHDKIKDEKCLQCDYTCSVKSNLKKHLKTCTGKTNMSSMEYNMKQALDDLKIEYMYNTTHNNLKGTSGYLRFDFVIPTNDESFSMIEMNGRQHYEAVCFGGIEEARALENFERQLAHDGLKRAYCEKNGYPLLEVRYNDSRDYKAILQKFIEEYDIQV